MYTKSKVSFYIWVLYPQNLSVGAFCIFCHQSPFLKWCSKYILMMASDNWSLQALLLRDGYAFFMIIFSNLLASTGCFLCFLTNIIFSYLMLSYSLQNLENIVRIPSFSLTEYSTWTWWTIYWLEKCFVYPKKSKLIK